MTNREFFNAIINANVSDELTAHATDELEKLDKRNAQRSSKPSAQNTQHSNNNHFRNPISFLVYLKYTPNFGKSQEKYSSDDNRLNFFVKIFTSIVRLNFL